MLSKWTSHLKDPDEAERFELTVHSSKSVLERLSNIVDEERQGCEIEEVSWKSFEQPNWKYKQAYIAGYKAALKTITKLLDLGDTNDRKPAGPKQRRA